VAGRWAYLYRAVDELGQVVDVLLRSQRDLVSARAFFAHAIRRRRVTPDHVVTDKHQAYVRAVRRHARRALHTRTGLHRARGETTKPVERSHVPIKDRLRPMRGLQSVPSGQRLLEGIEAIQAIRRGVLAARPGGASALATGHVSRRPRPPHRPHHRHPAPHRHRRPPPTTLKLSAYGNVSLTLF
jgi:transposase-like protein